MKRREAPRPSAKRGSKRTTLGRAPLWAILALAGTVAVGGTAAFLLDETNKVVNTFQSAEVTCAVVESFDGSVKSNVGVQNTGDVDAYLRAVVVVNWAKQGKGESLEVYPETPVVEDDYFIVFDTPSGGGDTPWVECDGYWYYTLPVGPGEVAESLILSCSPVEGSAPEGYSLYVDVISSAVQAEPVVAVQDAWGVSISDGGVAPVLGS